MESHTLVRITDKDSYFFDIIGEVIEIRPDYSRGEELIFLVQFADSRFRPIAFLRSAFSVVKNTSEIDDDTFNTLCETGRIGLKDESRIELIRLAVKKYQIVITPKLRSDAQKVHNLRNYVRWAFEERGYTLFNSITEIDKDSYSKVILDFLKE